MLGTIAWGDSQRYESHTFSYAFFWARGNIKQTEDWAKTSAQMPLTGIQPKCKQKDGFKGRKGIVKEGKQR